MLFKLKSIQMVFFKLIPIATFVLGFSIFAFSQPYIDALTIDGLMLPNNSSVQSWNTGKLFITADNVLHVDASVQGLEGEIHWAFKVDINNDGRFENTAQETIFSTTTSTESLSAEIELPSDVLVAITLGEIPISVIASTDNNFSEDLQHLSPNEAAILARLSGPILVNNSADASQRCLQPLSKNIETIYLKNRTAQTIYLSNINLEVTAPHFIQSNQDWDDLEFFPGEERSIDLLFSNMFKYFDQTSFEVYLQYGWSYSEANFTRVEQYFSFDICQGRNHFISNYSNNSGVFPNPFDEVLMLPYFVGEAATVEIEMYNQLGQKVKTILKDELADIGQHLLHIQTDDLQPGLYFIQIKIGDIVKTQRVIKQN